MTDSEFTAIYRECRPFTMTSKERMFALFRAVDYVVCRNVEGAMVEAGVWRGGSSMLIARALMNRQILTRPLYLYDTFEGMPEPADTDVNLCTGRPAAARWTRSRRANHSTWCYAPLETVRENMHRTGYPPDQVTFVKGRVEDTLPGVMPGRIALLRLDTDWYASTAWELTCLYPRLAHGGVLIIDDYGHWAGVRKAVDEYFQEASHKILLNRIDTTGRIGVKI